MNLSEIKNAIENGHKVFWSNGNYEVIKDSIGQYLIHSKSNDNYIGLTWQDKKTLNGQEKDFYTLLDDKEMKTNANYYADYFEAMFWADIDENEDCNFNDEGLGIYDIERHCFSKQVAQLDDFFSKAESILEKTDYDDKQAQHDFYFTRQGHGVGFWENDHAQANCATCEYNHLMIFVISLKIKLIFFYS